MTFLGNPNTFADYPLEKSGHRRKDKAWQAEALKGADAQLVLFQNMNPLCDAKGVLWLSGSARDQLCGAAATTLFLGEDEKGAPYFAALFSGNIDESPIAGLGAFEDMRAVVARITGSDAAIVGCAKALFEWHAKHGHCANCGERTKIADGGWKRECAECKTEHFPRVDPVVIMLPTLGDRCCLGRQSRFPRGMYSALAGFIEPGESMEEACAREVQEEVGLTVTRVRYHSTQPWPFPSSLMIGLICEVTGDALTLDKDEIDEAIWLTRDEARAAISGGATLADGTKVWAPPAYAIAHQIVKAWVEGE
jgi:NAD+ diphosphatase